MSGHTFPLYSAEAFWRSYAGALNEEGGKSSELYKAYQGVGIWTPDAMRIAEEILEDKLDLRIQREYFRVDLIGYKTQTKKQAEDIEEQSRWDLKVAFEHENTTRWDRELCKLCHVVADLRVIVSYYDLRPEKKRPIEEELQRRVKKLRLWRMHRVPNSQWLFIFGPKVVSQQFSYRAYTVDSELNVHQIAKDVEVIPDQWKKS